MTILTHDDVQKAIKDAADGHESDVLRARIGQLERALERAVLRLDALLSERIDDKRQRELTVGDYLLCKAVLGDEHMASIISEERIARENALKEATNALQFYAGEARDATWNKSQFIAVDHYGGLSAELSGPAIAKQALMRIEKMLKGRF